MGIKTLHRARNPQPDGKKDQKKKSLKEFAGSMKADMQEKVRNEAMRRVMESRKADEDLVLAMAFGPAPAEAAE